MFDAQYIFEGESLLSPWLSRRADNLTIYLQVLKLSSSSTSLIVEVLEKDTADTGSGTPVPGSQEIDTTESGVFSSSMVGVKQLVRYKMSLGSSSGSNYALFRVLPSVWFDSVLV